MVTGWNWLLLTDFASFKPTYLPVVSTELQIRGGIEDNSKTIFFLFLDENIYCDPSFEPPQ